ncbi:hypothetical protein BDU57DRAFT_259391 [Ampelomyces quisqualis]|uniref:Uncharacterized protein n=1 Tax=Ampelomyces quisqualis TaxID=50730 RepID=A0A6A5QQV9_AMPQU|nr:hypothetical protein BDU57DRAFT_259391 [Ampelomyces quisqualis]
MLGFINRLLGRTKNTLPPFDFARNHFRRRKQWPPNLKTLTEKQQFRFERKFKRRVKMKAVSETWNRRVTVVIWSLISFVVVYGVLFHDFANDPMNPRPGEQPFVGLRRWMWDKLGGFYTHTEESIKGGERGSRREVDMPDARARGGPGGKDAEGRDPSVTGGGAASSR